MDYEEACEAIVTRREAQREINKHDATFPFRSSGLFLAEFVLEYGDKEEYHGQDVLDFLGY